MKLCAGLLPAALSVLLAAALPQEKPLERSFAAGANEQYRVRLVVRSELEGEQPVRRSGAVFAQKFERFGEGGLKWVTMLRVAAIGPDGSAEIEETLTDFNDQLTTSAPPGADEDAGKLFESISQSLRAWKRPGRLVLRYRATPSGQLLSLGPEGVPSLTEAQPPLLTLWLLRALRPEAALPNHPVEFGQRWQEPRTVSFPGWQGVQASESGQWLEAFGAPEPAVRLLIVQQILGTVAAGPEKPPEGTAQARFHGESLATISLRDGRLLGATRSASRELSWTLEPVPGLLAPPQFHAQLSAQVEIAPCHGPC
jgi:hypothetical protein